MKLVGYIILLVGLILAFSAFFFATSVAGPSTFGGEPVNNIGLLNTRSLLLNAGGFLWLGGIILVATGYLLDVIAAPASDKPNPKARSKRRTSSSEDELPAFSSHQERIEFMKRAIAQAQLEEKS